MLIRKGFFLCLLGVLAFTASGCWDSQQLNQLALVSSIALDRANDGQQIQLTVTTINRSAFERNASFPDNAEKVAVFSSTGHTPFEAVRNFTLQSGEKLFWGHADAMVIGEELAKQGVLPWIDFFFRDVEPRMRMKVFVAKNQKAKDTLQVRPRVVATPARHLTGLAAAEGFSTRSVDIDLKTFFEMLANKYGGTLAGRVEIMHDLPQPIPLPQNATMGPTREAQTESVRLTGAAVLKDGKLVGWLDQRQARGWSWIKGQAHRGTLVVECLQDPNLFATVEMFQSKVDAAAKMVDDQLRIRLNVELEARLGDQMCADDLSTVDAQNAVAQRTAAVIENDIKQVLTIARKLDTDIFGFSQLVFRAFPQTWKQIRDRWDQIFPTLPVDIDVRVELRRTGRNTKSIWGLRKAR